MAKYKLSMTESQLFDRNATNWAVLIIVIINLMDFQGVEHKILTGILLLPAAGFFF